MSVGTENYPSNFQDSGFQHEEIFIYVKYKIKSHYIKLNFKSDLKIVKAAISEVFGGLQMDNYNLFWDEAQILEEDLVALIKAKKSCGYFKLIVDEKEMSSCKNIKQEPSNFLEEESALEGFVDDQTDNDSKKSTKNIKVESQISEEDNFNAFHFLEIENQEPHTSKSLIETTEDENLTTFNFVDFLKENIVTKTLLEASSSDYSSELLLKRSVISAAVKFLFRHCGTLPTKHQKDLMIQVILDVFKHLNFEDMNLFKVITVKMSNERVKMRKEDSDRKRKTEDHESPAALKKRKELEHQTECLKERRKIQKEDFGFIENVLKRTLSYRLEQMADPNFSVFGVYKSFTSNIHLINYDFQLRFPDVQEKLMENFQIFLNASRVVYVSDKKRKLPEEDCLFDLRKLLIICHYCKTPRANNLPLHTIQEMMAEFIWFSIVEEDTKPKFRDYPIIFAQGSSKKEIQKYSLIIKDLEIELPQNTSFIESFDYLIKTYYVLNINFPSILKVCFDFIMLNIYKIKTKSKIDTKKPEIENRYSKPNNFLFNVESWIEQNSK